MRPTSVSPSIPVTPGRARTRSSAASLGRAARTRFSGDATPRRPLACRASATWRALADVGSELASTPATRTPRAGSASATSSPPLASATSTGRRITAWASRAQPRPVGTCRQRRGASALIRLPSTTSSAGSEIERDGSRSDGDERAAHRHRREEAERKDSERAHRRRHGERAEDDRPARRRERRTQGLEPRPTALDLLPVPRHEQQAVVDREAEAEPGDEVEREHRDVHHLRDRSQPQQVSPIAPSRRAGAATRQRSRGRRRGRGAGRSEARSVPRAARSPRTVLLIS